MIDPLPCLTVGIMWLGLKALPGSFQLHFLPSEPNRLILVSSDHMTRFQSSTVQCWYFFANPNRATMCRGLRSGFFTLAADFNPLFRSTLLIVVALTMA